MGWWKNSCRYFAKVLNAAFWIGVDVGIDGEPLDLATVAEVKGFLPRDGHAPFGADAPHDGHDAQRRRSRRRGSIRFLSLTRRELGVVRYAVTPLAPRRRDHLLAPLSTPTCATPTPTYDEKFWEPVLTDGDVTETVPAKSGFRAHGRRPLGSKARSSAARRAAREGPSCRRGALRRGPHEHVI